LLLRNLLIPKGSADTYEPCRDQRHADKYFQSCKTAFRPYDLAATAFLAIAKHHLGGKILVESDGTIMHWMDAVKLCQNVLGYGFELCSLK